MESHLFNPLFSLVVDPLHYSRIDIIRKIASAILAVFIKLDQVGKLNEKTCKKTVSSTGFSDRGALSIPVLLARLKRSEMMGLVVKSGRGRNTRYQIYLIDQPFFKEPNGALREGNDPGELISKTGPCTGQMKGTGTGLGVGRWLLKGIYERFFRNKHYPE